MAVNHNDFPMVPVIHAQVEPSQEGREEHAHLNPCFFHFLPKLFRHEPAAHSVAEDTDLHALLYLFQQDWHNGIKQLVIFNDIVLDVDEPPGLAELIPQGLELLLPVREYLHLIVYRQHGTGGLQVIEDQAFEIPGHGIHHLLGHVIRAYDFLLALNRDIEPVADFLYFEHPAFL